MSSKERVSKEDIDEEGEFLFSPLRPCPLYPVRKYTTPDPPPAQNTEANTGQDAVKNHKKYFVDDDDSEADAHGLGAAAAMNAFIKFNKGEEDKAAGKEEGKFLALAMAEGSKVRFFPPCPSPLFLYPALDIPLSPPLPFSPNPQSTSQKPIAPTDTPSSSTPRRTRWRRARKRTRLSGGRARWRSRCTSRTRATRRAAPRGCRPCSPSRAACSFCNYS